MGILRKKLLVVLITSLIILACLIIELSVICEFQHHIDENTPVSVELDEYNIRDIIEYDDQYISHAKEDFDNDNQILSNLLLDEQNAELVLKISIFMVIFYYLVSIVFLVKKIEFPWFLSFNILMSMILVFLCLRATL